MSNNIGKAKQQNKCGRKFVLRRLAGLLLMLLILFLLILFLPFLARYRALLVMSAYDLYCERTSVPEAMMLTIDMPLSISDEQLLTAHDNPPSHKMDYLPLMITFNDDAGMSAYLSRDLRFTVDYAVADFSLFGRHSHFYEPEHPLYNSYIGAYYLSGYGKEAKDPATALDLATSIAAFDQTRLALPALGLDSGEAVFNILETEEQEKWLRGGLTWSSYTAAIETNGGEHESKKFLPSYLQFGTPPQAAEDYPLREMKGRFYFTYIEEKDLFLGLYALLSDEGTLELIDQFILQSASIDFIGKE